MTEGNRIYALYGTGNKMGTYEERDPCAATTRPIFNHQPGNHRLHTHIYCHRQNRRWNTRRRSLARLKLESMTGIVLLVPLLFNSICVTYQCIRYILL